MDVVALMPWWAGVALAIGSFALFHWLANRPQPAMTDARQVGALTTFVMVSAIRRVLQVVAPVLCLAGAAMSFFRRSKRMALVTAVTESASADALNGMSWREFELLVGEGFRLQGYQVQEMGGAQPDGGVDLQLRRGNETWLVQCKQWKAMKVGVDVVRELYGVMAARGAAGGFVVTSGRFTPDAIEFAGGRNVRLADGPQLLGLLQRARGATAVKDGADGRAMVSPAAPAAVATVPACPKCNAPMVLRTAKQGARAGSQFWGCSAFPACRGTR